MKNYLLAILLCYTGVSSAQNVPVSVSRTPIVPEITPRPYTNSTINYIRSWEPSMPTSDPTAVISSTSIQEVKQSTQYFDGLGNLLQVVLKGASPSGKDIVSPSVYDEFGREQYKYMPFTSTSNDGKFKSNPFQQDSAFSKIQYPEETVNYAQIDYEPSPLNRALKSFSQGNSWAKLGGNRPIEQQYFLNTTTDAVRIWDVSVTGLLPTSTRGAYGEGQLFKNVYKDERGMRTVEFRDKNNRLILKRSELVVGAADGYDGWLCTYYVYDNTGNLRCVIPPRAIELIKNNWILTTAIADELCFIYRFDGRNRMTVQKVPGADSTEMVYDVRDRLVFTRDGNMKKKNQWKVSFYDVLNRPAMTALYNSNSTRDALQISMNTAVTNIQTITYTTPAPSDLVIASHDGRPQYTARNSITFENGFDSGTHGMVAEINNTANQDTVSITATNPLPGIASNALAPLTYAFYDNYNYTGKHDPVSDDFTKPQYYGNPYAEVITTSSSMTQGLPTGARVRVLGTDQWLTTTVYYTDKGRVLQTISDNTNEGKDVLTSLYDFSGKILSTYLRHSNLRSSITPQTTVMTQMLYDAGGRLTQEIKQLNDDIATKRTIFQNTYNEQIQLRRKRIGLKPTDNKFLDSLDYEYNIRGWVKSINKTYLNSTNSASNWFGQELSYDYGFTANQYNGNIAGVKWKSKSDSVSRAYGYSYDNANRLITADFTQVNRGNTGWTRDKMDFSVSGLVYDANGNIQFMNQRGMNGTNIQTIDSLKYGYLTNSNKLSFVTDRKNNAQSQLGDFKEINNNETADYAYDSSGNLIKDLNKNIAIITYNHLNLPDSIVFTGKGNIKYVYDAAGNRLKKIVTDNTGSTAKITTTDYIGDFVYNNDTLQFLNHEEGRIRPVLQSGQPIDFKYDYFVKDHLGNVRMVLTEQTDFSMYAATMETQNAANESALFSNIEETRTVKPVGYPQDDATPDNHNVAKLNAKDGGKKIGPSLVLRVMAGDTVQMGARAFYKSIGPKDKKSVTPQDMVAALLQAFGGGVASKGASHSAGGHESLSPFRNFNSNDYQRLKEKDADPDQQDKPKAYLNFALFDDQFNLVDENSGFRQIKGTPDELQTLAVDKMPIEKSGFLYVYTSNETAQDVFFDNVTLAVNSGPLLEETHYYPFGLTMVGISRSAAGSLENKRKYNGASELQSKEFSDGSGLELYETFYRSLDPQIGRFWQIDPKPNTDISLYASMENNPVLYNDPLGDTLLTKRDHRKINGITKNLEKTNENLNKESNKLNGKIAEAESKGKTNKVKDLKKDLNDVNERIAENNKTLSNINAVVMDPNQAYTFVDAIGNEIGGTFMKTMEVNGKNQDVVVMRVRNDVNAVHELTHAYQGGVQHMFTFISNSEGTSFRGYKTIFESDAARAYSETQAYRAQYAFSPESMPPTITGYIPDAMKNINAAYVGYLYTLPDPAQPDLERRAVYPAVQQMVNTIFSSIGL